MISHSHSLPLLLALAASAAAAEKHRPEAQASPVPAPAVAAPAPGMKRFIIVRHFPAGAVEGVDAEAKKQINATNAAKHVKWVHSFATPDKNTTVCIYDGPDEQAIRDAARANNMPADEIFEVPNVVLPR